TTSEVMKSFDGVVTVDPDLPAIEALDLIGKNGVNQLPVVENGKLHGIISREQILNYLFMRDELNI
ncbi:CBS domain-containing protein, partial [Escherichia coli]|nr:CBS domain-containing protein [Escherichia coli]